MHVLGVRFLESCSNDELSRKQKRYIGGTNRGTSRKKRNKANSKELGIRISEDIILHVQGVLAGSKGDNLHPNPLKWSCPPEVRLDNFTNRVVPGIAQLYPSYISIQFHHPMDTLLHN